MYPNMSFPAPAAFLASQLGAENNSGTIRWILWILGGLLVVSAFIVLVFVPSTRLSTINERLKLHWHEIDLDLSLIAVLLLLGLACIAGSIYVSEPSRIVKAFNEHLENLSRENATLQTELRAAQQEVENTKKVTITLSLSPPPGVDLSKTDRLQCHYWLSDDQQVFTDVERGTAEGEVWCRIVNIPPEIVIMRINVEEKSQIGGQARGGKLLAFRESIYPARPNYHLCAPNQTSCAEQP